MNTGIIFITCYIILRIILTKRKIGSLISGRHGAAATPMQLFLRSKEICMEEIPLNIMLGDEIAKWVAVRGKTKMAVAKHLEMDQTVFSQILKGQKTPSRQVLEKLMIYLSVEEGRREVMRRILSYLLLHPRGKTVWDSSNLKAMRVRRGLTLPMLSNRTGIMTSRLALLELKNAALPSEEEDLRLRCVFEGSGSSSAYYESEYADTLALKNAVVPVLHLSDMASFEKGMKLEHFVRERAVEDTLWMLHHPDMTAVVIANCEDLQLSMPGVAILAICGNRDDLPHKMELWRDPEGKFSLCELVNRSWKLSVFSDRSAEFKLREWALPVLDIVFKPYDFEMEIRRR